MVIMGNCVLGGETKVIVSQCAVGKTSKGVVIKITMIVMTML